MIVIGRGGIRAIVAALTSARRRIGARLLSHISQTIFPGKVYDVHSLGFSAYGTLYTIAQKCLVRQEREVVSYDIKSESRGAIIRGLLAHPFHLLIFVRARVYVCARFTRVCACAYSGVSLKEPVKFFVLPTRGKSQLIRVCGVSHLPS